MLKGWFRLTMAAVLALAVHAIASTASLALSADAPAPASPGAFTESPTSARPGMGTRSC